MATLPIPSRRTELAFLYAALAKDLAAWKTLNTGKSEVADSPPDPPVVWRLHAVAARYRVLLGDPTASFTEPTDLMNKELRAQQVRLGGEHKLEAAQVVLLMTLMLDSTNAPLAPYEPPAAISGW